MNESNRLLLSGDEAIALAARHAGVALGAGYPGTPSTEILEHFHALGGHAQWSPNEKVALEVALGAAFGGARALCTMKHVGLNVAADPLFTAAYTGVTGALIVVSADDPGMASSQNEQDNRHYAVAAGLPMLEPSDSQEAYDFLFAAVEISERWKLPVLFRVTTRVCHSYTVVRPRAQTEAPRPANYEKDVQGRVMIPAYARPAHRRLRQKLAELREWNEASPLNRLVDGAPALGIITSGISFMHVREAAPEARVLKLGFTHPLPLKRIAQFARGVERCLVVEEGDPFLVEAIRAAGIPVEGRRTGSGSASWTCRACAAFSSGTKAPNRPSRPASRRSFATAASIESSSRRCAGRIASWRAISGATRWECCRLSRRLTPASAWGRAWGSGWACATCCRPNRRGGW